MRAQEFEDWTTAKNKLEQGTDEVVCCIDLKDTNLKATLSVGKRGEWPKDHDPERYVGVVLHVIVELRALN